MTGPAFAASQAPLPALSGSVAIGGSGGWDYVSVDPASHLVYVSHESRFHIVDPAAGKVVAEIPGLAGVHGIALALEWNRGFITCGKEDKLAVVDLATSAVIARIPTGSKPDAVLYDAFSRRVFVANNDGASLTVVDPASQKAVGTVALAGAPETVQSDGAGKLYVNLEDTNQVQVVDARTLKVLATWSLAPHATPTGMAIDAAHNRLFVGCRSGQLVVLDLLTGGIKATVPIGAGVDACAFDPETRRVFASCKDGTLAVIAAETHDAYTLVGTLTTESGSKTMTLDPSTHMLFVPAAGKDKAGFQLLQYKQ
jgi:DNA-binding beta-propeller fold protein YncE